MKKDITLWFSFFCVAFTIITIAAFSSIAQKDYNDEEYDIDLSNGFENEPTDGDILYIYKDGIDSFTYNGDTNECIIEYTNPDQNIWSSCMYISIDKLTEILNTDDRVEIQYHRAR